MQATRSRQVRRDGTEPLLAVDIDASKAGTSGSGTPAAAQADAPQSGAVGHLLQMAVPDTHILVIAFSAGLLAAWGNALIPFYLGKAIEAASLRQASTAFHGYVRDLVLVAVGTGVVTAVRGGLFTTVGARINRRIRERLFTALMQQEVGFFDTTKAGDITSRLSADTTTVADQISLNVNVFARSVMQVRVRHLRPCIGSQSQTSSGQSSCGVLLL